MDLLTVASTVAVVSVSAVLLTYFAAKKRFESVRVAPEVDTFFSEVIFFPDKGLAAGNGSREAREANYRDVLDSSRPLAKLVGHLQGAQKTLDVCLYLVTSRELADAVLGRIARGVKVRLILDDGSVGVGGSQAGEFRARGAHVRSKPMPFLMHHKFAIIDSCKLVSGSFNWTMQAVIGNKENVIVTEEPRIVHPFVKEFEELWLEASN